MLNLSHLRRSDFDLLPNAYDPVRAILDQIRKDAESAIKKTDVAELTNGEKFALAYYARVPLQPNSLPEDGSPYEFRMTTVPCGFFHNGEKWVVTMRAEDER